MPQFGHLVYRKELLEEYENLFANYLWNKEMNRTWTFYKIWYWVCKAPQDKFPATRYILSCVGVPQKQGLDRSKNNAKNAQTKNIKFLIYKFHRTQLQCSPTQQPSLVISHSIFYSNTNHHGKMRQVFLRIEVWALVSSTVYPQPRLSLWQCFFWPEVSLLGSTGVLEEELSRGDGTRTLCLILDGLVTTPHRARNPLQGVSWDWSQHCGFTQPFVWQEFSQSRQRCRVSAKRMWFPEHSTQRSATGGQKGSAASRRSGEIWFHRRFPRALVGRGRLFQAS